MNALVPIAVPEMLLEGDHDIKEAPEYTERKMRFRSYALGEYDICLEGLLLKIYMISPELIFQTGMTPI